MGITKEYLLEMQGPFEDPNVDRFLREQDEEIECYFHEEKGITFRTI